MTTKTETKKSNKSVPFFILHLSGDKVKALFTVPSSTAEALVSYPILCRGASFDLSVDEVSQSRENTLLRIESIRRDASFQNIDISFLSTQFSSPNPEETARAIAERIAIRQENPSPNVSHLFG